MEQESPDNEITAREEVPDGAYLAAETADGESSPQLEPPAALMTVSDRPQIDTSVNGEFDSAPVVDPYTAAPPAAFFDPGVPFGDEPAAGDAWQDPTPLADPFVPLPYLPVDTGETVRRSGLAWSAGVAFFGSVAFTLFLGWLADQLLGTSPWGIVFGIVLGSIIGFLQFFRITSRIFTAGDELPRESPIMSVEDEDTSTRF